MFFQMKNWRKEEQNWREQDKTRGLEFWNRAGWFDMKVKEWEVFHHNSDLFLRLLIKAEKTTTWRHMIVLGSVNEKLSFVG